MCSLRQVHGGAAKEGNLRCQRRRKCRVAPERLMGLKALSDHPLRACVATLVPLASRNHARRR